MMIMFVMLILCFLQISPTKRDPDLESDCWNDAKWRLAELLYRLKMQCIVLILDQSKNKELHVQICLITCKNLNKALWYDLTRQSDQDPIIWSEHLQAFLGQ